MTAVEDPIPPDTRPIDEMPFGSGAPDPLSVAKAVRDTLRKCGVTVAHEIEELGCTGASAKGLSPMQIADLRLGLAGGGVGLPCFVPITRYCLAHSTIGGLQVGQASRHSEEIAKISRELSPRERGQVELIEASRRVRGGDLGERLMKTADALSGRDLPPGVEHVENEEEEVSDGPELSDVIERNRQIARGWVCPEHRTPVWACRYCVAQMVVEGSLAPRFVVREENQMPVAVGNVEETLNELTRKGVGRVEVYATVATFTRKLARD